MGVRVVGEVPLRVVAEGVDEVAPRNVRLEDEALGAREGDVVEVGGDAADAALVVRREVDLTRPGAVGHRGGEEWVRLEGRGVLLSGFLPPSLHLHVRLLTYCFSANFSDPLPLSEHVLYHSLLRRLKFQSFS